MCNLSKVEVTIVVFNFVNSLIQFVLEASLILTKLVNTDVFILNLTYS